MVLKLGLLTKGIICFIIAHIGAFYQLNGQFIWKSFRDNEWVVVSIWIPHFLFLYLGNKIYS